MLALRSRFRFIHRTVSVGLLQCFFYQTAVVCSPVKVLTLQKSIFAFANVVKVKQILKIIVLQTPSDRSYQKFGGTEPASSTEQMVR